MHKDEVEKHEIPESDVEVIVGPWESAYGVVYPNGEIGVFVGWHLSSEYTRHQIAMLRALADEEYSGKPDWSGDKFVVKNKTSDVPELVGRELVEFSEDRIRECHQPLEPQPRNLAFRPVEL
jgi:hypothetical protein